MRRAARSQPTKRTVPTATSEVWHIGADGAVQHLLDNPQLLTTQQLDPSTQSNDSSFNIQQVIEQYERRVHAAPDEQFQLNDLLEVLPNRHRLKRLKEHDTDSNEVNDTVPNTSTSTTSVKRKRKPSKARKNARSVHIVDDEFVESGSEVDIDTINNSLDSFYAKVAAESDSDVENIYRRPRPTAPPPSTLHRC